MERERREEFYREFRFIGSFFGLAEDYGPRNYGEFVDYYAEMLENEVLGSHPLCAEIAAAVVRPRKPWRDRALGWMTDFLPVETIPEGLRERLGLRSTVWTRARMALLKRVAPTAFEVLPARWTHYPESYRAARACGLC